MKNNLIEKATSFAADKHKNQYRKEGHLLYISHLVGVALILKKYNFDDMVIAAGLLHDTLEDTQTSKEEILENFGQEILEIISSVSYDKNLEWKEARLQYIENVKNGDAAVKAISLADKIHNMKSLLFSLQNEGENAWSNFSKPKEIKIWFEEECLKMFESAFPHPMVFEYKELLDELKEKYF